MTYPKSRWLGIATAFGALLAGCGGGGGGGSSNPVTPPVAFTAEKACTDLAGKTIAGTASVTSLMVFATASTPAHCRVNGTIAPRHNFEMRLPDNWNRKLHYEGGGGYNGVIPALFGLSLDALRQGYASVSSDSGHQGSPFDASFALNDAQAAQLFGSQSVPAVMAVAQEVLRTAYGSAAERSYFEGCSNGGREGLISAQRNPQLFDGVVARAPSYNWTGLMGAFHRNVRALAAPGGQLSDAQVSRLAKAVRDACDNLDGIADGIVSNPRACAATFNPASLRCPGEACLTDAQFAFVTSWTTDATFAGGYRNAGWNLTGNEDDAAGWPEWITGSGDFRSTKQFAFEDTTVKHYIARDPNVDSVTYAPYDQNPAALAALAALNDATSTDLGAFAARGGKLILWHGGSDAALSVNSTAEYFGAIANRDAFARFYVAPGVNHCSGGPGADSADLLGALDAWVTRGTAPETLTARKVARDGTVLLSRPLCRYPQYPNSTSTCVAP